MNVSVRTAQVISVAFCRFRLDQAPLVQPSLEKFNDIVVVTAFEGRPEREHKQQRASGPAGVLGERAKPRHVTP